MIAAGQDRAANVRSDVTAAKELAAGLIADCAPGERFDAHDLLRRHPELRNSRSAVVELTYEEYCRRIEQGEKLVAAEFAERFPEVQRSLLHLIEVHRLLAAESAMYCIDRQPLWPQIGESWLGYDLLEKLGEGAYSRVFLAQEQSLGGRQVVLKVTPLGSREARTLAQLAHPHIVPVHSVQRDEDLGLTGICMPFLSRVTLFDVVDEVFARTTAPRSGGTILEAARLGNAGGERATLSHARPAWPVDYSYVEAILSIGAQLADALDHAHRHGTLHCDVKPSNVLLTNEGHAYLLDFNLALLGAEAARVVGGTLPYMAPEQLEPLRKKETPPPSNASVQTDVFSLGAVLYEMLSGRLPFGGFSESWSREQVASHFYARQQSGAAALTETASNVDRAVSAIVARCLEFSPDRRWPSMAALAEALRAELGSRRRLMRRARTRRRPILVAATCVLACLMAAAVVVDRQESTADHEFRLAADAIQNEHFDEAVERFTRVLAADPERREARYRRAEANLRRGDYVAARLEYVELAEKFSDGRGLAGAADVARATKDEQHAIELYRRAIDAGFKTPQTYAAFGECLLNQGQQAAAREALLEALQIDPQFPNVQHLLAKVEFRHALSRQAAPRLTYIESALDEGNDSAELQLDAAFTFALAARHAKNESERQRYLAQTLEHCRRSVKRGMNPQFLKQVLGLYPELEGDPQFREISQGEGSL